jgi:hypothetical protein
MAVLTRARNTLTGLAALVAQLDPAQRRLYGEMQAYMRALPAQLNAPLPQVVAQQTPTAADLALAEPSVRRLADAAALFERRSPLGLCLRRSLVRYHYLRRAGVPLTLNFGARFKGGQADRDIAGHAWTTLNGAAYHEDGENYQDFVTMLKFPQES